MTRTVTVSDSFSSREAYTTHSPFIFTLCEKALPQSRIPVTLQKKTIRSIRAVMMLRVHALVQRYITHRHPVVVGQPASVGCLQFAVAARAVVLCTRAPLTTLQQQRTSITLNSHRYAKVTRPELFVHTIPATFVTINYNITFVSAQTLTCVFNV